MIDSLNQKLRTIRGGVRSLFRQCDPSGGEKPKSYYDSRFKESTEFQVPFYESPYYSTWLVIVDRLRRYKCDSILDVGCGPGQFAALCDDWGFQSYTGLDFSRVAINMAQRNIPRFDFIVADVRDKSAYANLDFDAIVCTEVLEHIEKDMAVLSCFPDGTRCLITVPNYPWKSHVRHFTSEQAVVDRYGPCFDSYDVIRIKGTRSENEQFYLVDGIRNSLSVDHDSAAENSRVVST